MGKLRIPLIAFLLALLWVAAASAQQEWSFILQSGDDTIPFDRTVIGVSSDAIDNYDSADKLNIHAAIIGFRIYHSSADGWSGPQGFYSVDIRQPPVTTKTWADIYLWWEPGSTYLNWPLHFFPYQSTPPPPGYRFTLYLDQVPVGVSYNGPWSWELSSTAKTTIPAGTFTPFVSETGLDSYRFHLTVAVPEPTSLAALAGGLAGFGVAAFRPKKRLI